MAKPENQNNHVPYQQLPQLKQWTIIAYACFALTFYFHLVAIVAVIIAYLKRDEAQGTIYYSHLQYIIRTFWMSLGIALIGLILLIIIIGWLIMLIGAVWTIYRLLKGIMYILDNKEINYQTWF